MNNHGKFSKRVITAMIILFFAGALFGGGVIIYQLIHNPEIVNLDSFLNYLGLPIGGGVVGYLIKSAMENRKKIECNPEEESEIEELEDI
jgi:TRAP-type C4-dicarboxylate transport system permease small subunit